MLSKHLNGQKDLNFGQNGLVTVDLGTSQSYPYCIAEQDDGISLARKIGVKFGRKKALSETQVQELRQKRTEGLLIKDLMEHYSLSKASVYRALGDGVEVQ